MWFNIDWVMTPSAEARENFRKILDKVLLLSDELKIDSKLSLCNLYSYLLYTGNLSIDRIFIQSTDDIVHDEGLNLMLGYGCCRNISSGLQSLLDKSKVENYMIPTKFNAEMMMRKYGVCYDFPCYFEEYELTFKDWLQMIKSVSEQKSRHVLNLIVDGDKYFAYDSTWGIILKISGSKLDLLGGIGNMHIDLDKEKFETYFYHDIRRNKNVLEEIKHKENIEYDEFKLTLIKDLEIFNSQYALIDDFYSDAHQDIENVAKFLTI